MPVILLGLVASGIFLVWLFPERSNHQEWFCTDAVETNGVTFCINGPPSDGPIERMTNPWRLVFTAIGKTNTLREVIVTEARMTTKEGQTLDILPHESFRLPFEHQPDSPFYRARSFLAEARNLPFHKDQTLKVYLKWSLVETQSTNEYARVFSLKAFLHDWSGHVFRLSWDKRMADLQSRMNEFREFANKPVDRTR